MVKKITLPALPMSQTEIEEAAASIAAQAAADASIASANAAALMALSPPEPTEAAKTYKMRFLGEAALWSLRGQGKLLCKGGTLVYMRGALAGTNNKENSLYPLQGKPIVRGTDEKGSYAILTQSQYETYIATYGEMFKALVE